MARLRVFMSADFGEALKLDVSGDTWTEALSQAVADFEERFGYPPWRLIAKNRR